MPVQLIIYVCALTIFYLLHQTKEAATAGIFNFRQSKISSILLKFESRKSFFKKFTFSKLLSLNEMVSLSIVQNPRNAMLTINVFCKMEIINIIYYILNII